VAQYSDPSGSMEFNKTNDTAFSYKCGGCGRCCVHKAIRVGPYEILRLARQLNLSTSEFIAKHTKSGGTILQTTPQAACVFLTDKGCGVHADRPLACRLYPLGLQFSLFGEPFYGDMQPHPQTKGVYGTEGTVSSYLENQGVAPYLAANEHYEKLYSRMFALLKSLDAEEVPMQVERRKAIDEMAAGTLASNWMDVDATLSTDLTASARSDGDLLDIVSDHVAALERILNSIEGGDLSRAAEPA
jgi:uncharacterized protein